MRFSTATARPATATFIRVNRCLARCANDTRWRIQSANLPQGLTQLVGSTIRVTAQIVPSIVVFFSSSIPAREIDLGIYVELDAHVAWYDC